MPEIDRSRQFGNEGFPTMQNTLQRNISNFSQRLVSPAQELIKKSSSRRETSQLHHFITATLSYDGYVNVQWRKTITDCEDNSDIAVAEIATWDNYRVGFSRYLRAVLLRWEKRRLEHLKAAQFQQLRLSEFKLDISDIERYEHLERLSDPELRKIDRQIVNYRDALDISMKYMRALLLNHDRQDLPSQEME